MTTPPPSCHSPPRPPAPVRAAAASAPTTATRCRRRGFRLTTADPRRRRGLRPTTASPRRRRGLQSRPRPTQRPLPHPALLRRALLQAPLYCFPQGRRRRCRCRQVPAPLRPTVPPRPVPALQGCVASLGVLLQTRMGVFSCGEPCGHDLACGKHACLDACHPGPCGECELVPGKVTACHCGKTRLQEKRASCLDPIPTCDKVCDKKLPCGAHRCRVTCHEGQCPPCLARVEQRCRCGSSGQMVECYRVSMEEFRCSKPCGRKKNCGRHRCSECCCPLSKPFARHEGGTMVDPHFCQIPCGKKLRCGQHGCQHLCHSGHCDPCRETIFSELTCACGRTSIPPPQPCGTPTPSCPHQCTVPRPCGHPALHQCHFGDCPPCVVPVMRECSGGHVMLRNIPCGSKDIRCNQPCGKNRRCGLHACARTCHPSRIDSTVAGGRLQRSY